jgi:hypothetical protein
MTIFGSNKKALEPLCLAAIGKTKTKVDNIQLMLFLIPLLLAQALASAVLNKITNAQILSQIHNKNICACPACPDDGRGKISGQNCEDKICEFVIINLKS